MNDAIRIFLESLDNETALKERFRTGSENEESRAEDEEDRVVPPRDEEAEGRGRAAAARADFFERLLGCSQPPQLYLP